MNKFTCIALGIMTCCGALVQAEPATTVAMQNSCQSLSANEQSFANGLTSANQALFCGPFSADQRAAAMAMTGQRDVNGNMMSPDQAVEKVAKDNNVKATMTGGCPAR